MLVLDTDHLVELDLASRAGLILNQRLLLETDDTMDLKIASIAIATSATLLSRNTRDFERIPNLHVEDWLS